MSNNCNTIHETLLKDIMDLYDEVKDIAKNGKVVKGKGPMAGVSSLSKASSNLTLVFPVICSRGISIENSSMISKAIEKNSVTMLQRMFTSWQIADSGVENAQDYIRQFHSNISSRVASLDDVFRVLDESTDTTIPSNVRAAFKEDARNLDYYLPSAVNNDSLNRFVVQEGAVFNKPGKSAEQIAFDKMKGTAELAKTNTDILKNQVLDSDFKKANELMPTSMVVNFTIKDPTTMSIIPVDSAVIGVKAKLYPISSNDIITHISDKTIDKNWITNFFRATTREISFMKDFVLAIDKAKIDAMSMSSRKNTSDKMWKVLERRATNSRLKRALRQNNNAAAITTLCVSQEEVEYLRKNYNVDIERIPNIIGLFESLNLMCVCIVDESLEVAKFIYDEDEPIWETVSFTHLERESSDNTYKKVVNLMTKMNH